MYNNHISRGNYIVMITCNSFHVLVASKVSEEEAHMKLMAFRPVCRF
jgi:hypothetical protein